MATWTDKYGKKHRGRPQYKQHIDHERADYRDGLPDRSRSEGGSDDVRKEQQALNEVAAVFGGTQPVEGKEGQSPNVVLHMDGHDGPATTGTRNATINALKRVLGDKYKQDGSWLDNMAILQAENDRLSKPAAPPEEVQGFKDRMQSAKAGYAQEIKAITGPDGGEPRNGFDRRNISDAPEAPTAVDKDGPKPTKADPVEVKPEELKKGGWSDKYLSGETDAVVAEARARPSSRGWSADYTK